MTGGCGYPYSDSPTKWSVATMSTLLLVYLHPSIAETGKGFPAAVPATGCAGHRKDNR